MINIRQGKTEDFKLLNQPWAWGEEQWERKAQKATIEGIEKNEQEFLVVEKDNELIGELHIHWIKNDTDEANGKTRAYLGALRLHPNHRKQGIGTKLMQHALNHIRTKGFKEATIGAYKHEPHIQELYKKWGFTEFIKEATEEQGDHKAEYILLMQRLN